MSKTFIFDSSKMRKGKKKKKKHHPDTVELVLAQFRLFKLGHRKLFKQMFLCRQIKAIALSYFFAILTNVSET